MSASKDSVSVTADLFFYQNQLKGINPNRAGQKYWRRLSSVTRIKIVTACGARHEPVNLAWSEPSNRVREMSNFDTKLSASKL